MHCKTHISHDLACISSTASRRCIALVALSPYFLYQALRHNKYVGSLGQRLGYLPVSFNLDGEESIWVHAVSVGEVLAARPLIAELRARYPEAARVPLDDDAVGAAAGAPQRVGRRRASSISRSTGRSPSAAR